MAKIRIGLGSEFNLNNGNLGLGVTNPQVRLDVDGTVKSKDFEVTGVTSFTAYEGFLRSDHQIDGDLTLNTGQGLNASLSGEIIVKDGVTFTVGAIGLGTTSVGVGTELITNTIDSNETNLAGESQIECLKAYNTFTPPSGGTNERPYAPKPGELYYNYDFKTIEFHDGYGWRQVDNTTRSGRGVFAGGWIPSGQLDSMDYINIHTLGNAINFGSLLSTSRMNAGCSSNTRGLFGCSYPSPLDQIEYITIASEGDSIDFGNLTSGRQHLGAHSSSTRGIFAGGAQTSDIIEYVEIPTLGDALDFGDLSAGRRNLSGCGSPTRAVFSQGGEFPVAISNNDFLTISSKGDSTKFLDGDYRTGIRCCSNNVRGLYGGGYVPTKINTIDYLTIASLGNMTDFGDLTRVTTEGAFISSQTRGVYSGGFNETSPSSASNSIEYVTIATTGNAIDFGDSTVSSGQRDGLSDSHGGLGGF